jgi:hypothetical protein
MAYRRHPTCRVETDEAAGRQLERLATRTNLFGKQPDELARVLEDRRAIEPLLRRGATLELDTSAPISKVVESITGHVGA